MFDLTNGHCFLFLTLAIGVNIRARKLKCYVDYHLPLTFQFSDQQYKTSFRSRLFSEKQIFFTLFMQIVYTNVHL